MRLSRSFTAGKRELLLGFATLCAATSFALNYDVQFTTTPPTIDGTADSAWDSASAAATNFVVYNNVGTPADQQTEVRLLWDSEKLYVLFEAEDSEIVAPATADHVGFNFGTPQDTAEIFLDPTLRQDPAQSDYLYHIAVNPADPVYTYTEAGQNQTSWVLGPDTELAFLSSGNNWKVEMAIPWTDLNSTQSLSPGIMAGAPPAGAVWGVQFGRLHSPGTSSIVASKWEPTPSSFRLRPYGTLTFTGVEPAPAVDLSGLQELYTTSFEAPAYTAGATASGIEDWNAANPDLFQVSADFAKTGTQSLKALAQSPTGTIRNGKKVTNTELAQYFQYAVRLPAEVGNGYRHVLYLSGEYAGGGGDVAGQVWFNSSLTGGSAISVYTYDNPETADVVSYWYPGMMAYNEWMYVTGKVDPVGKTYELWINGTKLTRWDGGDKFNVKLSNDFVQFSSVALYNKSYGTDPVYFDDYVQVLDATDSDVTDWQLF